MTITPTFWQAVGNLIRDSQSPYPSPGLQPARSEPRRADSPPRRDRPGLVVQADVGVPHRHADVAVASQLTGFDEGCTVSQQFGDVSVPSHCVEVGGSLFGMIGDASPLEVLLDHQPRSPFGQPGEERLIRWNALQPTRQHSDEMRMQRENVFPAVLGAFCFDGQRGRIGFQIEAQGRQAGDFGLSKSRKVAQQVDPGPGLPVVALDFDFAGSS